MGRELWCCNALTCMFAGQGGAVFSPKVAVPWTCPRRPHFRGLSDSAGRRSIHLARPSTTRPGCTKSVVGSHSLSSAKVALRPKVQSLRRSACRSPTVSARARADAVSSFEIPGSFTQPEDYVWHEAADPVSPPPLQGVPRVCPASTATPDLSSLPRRLPRPASSRDPTGLLLPGAPDLLPHERTEGAKGVRTPAP